MSATKTRRELVFRALAELGVIAAGQIPSDDDVSAVDALVDGMIDELAGRGTVYIDDPGRLGPAGGNYDPVLFLALGSWLANAAAPDFGSQTSEPAREALEHRMRQITSGLPTYEPLVSEHF